MAINMGSAIAYLELDTSKFSKGFTSAYNDLKVFGDKSSTAEQKFKGFSSALNIVGSGLAKSVTLPLLGIGTAAVNVTSKFDSAMSEVKAISGATGTQFTQLRDKAIEMGDKTKFSATESAEAFKYMAMAGWDTNDMLNSISGVMNLAAASGEDLGTVSDIVTDAMTAFGLAADGTTKVLKDGYNVEVSNAEHFSDVLAEASSRSNTNVSMMGETFKYVAPLAGTMGYTIEDTAVAIGLMANSSIKGGQAGTALRSLLTRLAKPTKESGTAMDALGISITNTDGSMKTLSEVIGQMRTSMSGLTQDQKASYAAMLAGQEGMSGLLAIINASDEDYNKLTESIQNCTGASQDMADTMLDNLGGAVTLLKSALESAGITIGDRLTPYIRDLTDLIRELVEKFKSLSDEQQDNIVKFGLIAAAAAPILLIASKLFSLLSSIIGIIITVGSALSTVFAFGLNATALSAAGASTGVTMLAGAIGFLTSPITLVIAAITALVAAFVIAYKKSETFRNFMNNLVEDLKTFFTETVPQAFEMFKEKVSEAFENVKQKIGEFKDKCEEVVQNVIEFFTVTLPQGIEQFATVTIPSFVQNVITFLQELPHNLGIMAGEMLGHLYLFATSAIEWATTAIPEFINSVVTFFQELPNRVWEWLVNTYNKVIEWGSNMIQKGIEVGMNFLQTVGEFFSQLPGRIWDFLSQTFQKVVAWGSQMVSNGRAAITGFVSTVVGIITSLPSKVWGILSKIPAKVRQLGSQLRSVGRAAFNALWDGIKSVGNSILDWVSDFASSIKSFISGIVEGFNSVVGSADSAKSAAASVKGRHANGLDYVPYNGYIAELHKGERVLTAQENKEYNEGRRGQGGDTFNFYNTKPEPYEYARQMKRARKELLQGI